MIGKSARVIWLMRHIDNPYDAKLLVEKEDYFARAIARGVTDYVVACIR